MEASQLSSLFEALRKAARPGIWSAGVKLGRAGAVVLESQDASEIVLRVKAPGRPVPRTAVLYPADESWECDCDGPVDPCEHVVAAALSLQQSESAGTQLVSAAEKFARVVYHLSRMDGGLSCKRALSQPGGGEVPLEGSLATLLAQPQHASKLQVEQCDIVADRLLERPTRLALPSERLEALLRVLEPSRNVLLEGRPVAVSDEVVFPRATVEDRGPAIVLILRRDDRITQVVSPRVALCGDALCRLGETELSGEWLQHLPKERAFEAGQVGELTSKLLPELAAKLPLEVKSQRLPAIDKGLRPHIQIQLNQLDGGLSVLPLLVYGSPPSVRIDNGKMVYLRGAVPLRDEAAEQKTIHQLREELDLVPGRRTTVQGQDAVRFADKLRRFRGSITGDGAAALSPGTKLIPELSTPSFTSPDGAPRVGFDFSFRLEGTKGEPVKVSAEAVLRAWSEGLGLVPLEGGGWAPLPKAWLDAHGQRVADLLAARAEDGQLRNYAAPALAQLCDELEQPRPAGLEQLLPLIEGFDRLEEAPLPSDLTASLRPYQRRGVSWLHFLRRAGVGGILADDMGLGKTLQALCAFSGNTLVVCPTSVLSNWEAELSRFRPSVRVCVYHGPGRALDAATEVTLTTYSILRLDAAILGNAKWDGVVLDEAQAIKNPDSQVARAAFALPAAFRLALSGTPVENRLGELWSLMHFANPGLLGGRREFDDKWAQPIAEGKAEAARKLRERIRPFVLRRMKREVAPELPPRTESVMHVVLDEKERATYDAVLAASRAEVVALLQQSGGMMKALEALLRLRQAACHPALVPGQTASTSSKVEALMEALETAAADGHKALVFSQWTSMLDLIEPVLKSAEISFERLDGSTQNRGEVTARFQAEEGPPVMLISLKAGGTGLNLTAADHVFLMDPWWNPAVEAQAADRAHRIGQERPVMVYRLVSKGTVEERILGLQEKKRALFDAAMGEASAAASLTKEDLLALLA